MNALGDAWIIAFAAYIVLSIVLPMVAHFLWGKGIWETRLVALLAAVYYLWLIPLALAVAAVALAMVAIPILKIMHWLFRWPNF
jgi:hypothetical protein